jgi:hypothetical protein
VLLDSQDRWINHHEVAIDGPVLHRDKLNPDLLHLYLLSYERHTLIGHYVISLTQHTPIAEEQPPLRDIGHVRR